MLLSATAAREHAEGLLTDVRRGRDSSAPRAALQRVGVVRQAMGTLVSVQAVHASAAFAEDAIDAAFAEMSRIVPLLDRHDAASPVSHLNDSGRVRDAPRELTALLERARRFHSLTRGAFDVTVKPLLDVAAAGRTSPRAMAEAAELVGTENVALRGREVRFTRAGMGVTLDGIAKGYVVDRMAEALDAHGLQRFLVNAGGDIRAAGGSGDGPWTIGVRDPHSPGELCGLVELTTGAIATSGNYLRRVPHLVDAAARRIANGTASVSVAAPDATTADAIATALFAMGPAEGLWLARLARCECLLVADDGGVVESPRWPSATQRQVDDD
jgi:thiamine biosynthesis lipoprotein